MQIKNPDKYFKTMISNANKNEYRANDNQAILFLFIVSIVLIIFCLLYVWKRGCNAWLPLPSPIYRWLLLTVVLLLAGCKADPHIEEPFQPHNIAPLSFTKEWYGECAMAESQGIREATDIVLTFSDGRQDSLIRNPFKQYQSYRVSIFGTNNTVYYITSLNSSESLIRYSERKGQSVFRIMGFNIQNCSESIVFEEIVEKDNKWSFLNNTKDFFLDNQNIYIVMPEDVYQVNRLTHDIVALNISTQYNIAYDGTSIYYLDQSLCLAKYMPDSGERSVFYDLAVGQFVLGPTGVYYTDLRQNEQLYFNALDGTESQLISTGHVTELQIRKDKLIYVIDQQEIELKIIA